MHRRRQVVIFAWFSRSATTLSDEEKKILLKVARKSIEANLRGQRVELPPDPDRTSLLKTPCGAFCTLEVQGQLRGCIGIVEAREALLETVSYCAISASSRDDRFQPIRPDEMSDVRIELSVLSPLWKIESPMDIEIGRHGIMIFSGHHQGLLLPQVAVQYGWDRTTFLEQTCRKAFLPKDAWKWPETTIKLFTAEVFHE